MKIKIWPFAFAWGIACGAYIMSIGWIAASGWAVNFVNAISSFYLGYAPTFVGGIIGGIWAFFDGAIGGLLIAWLYNTFAAEK